MSKLFVVWSHTTNNFRVSRKKNQENVVESVQKNIQTVSYTHLERTCGLIFCVYDISVAWDRQQCAGTFDQCGDNGTDTGIAAYHRHGSGGACGEGDHRWQPADWKSMYLACSFDECILFRLMYFYPDEKLYGDPGGSKNDRDLCVCAGGCRRGGGWDNGDGGVKNRDFQRRCV